MSKVRLVVVGCLIGAVLAMAGPVAAAKPTSPYYFYDCTGDGPSSFWAVKTALPGAASAPVSGASAFHVVDSSDVYSLVSFGNGWPPGIAHNSSYNLVCTVTLAGTPRVVYGVYTPAG
jgi:hypothetical protein